LSRRTDAATVSGTMSFRATILLQPMSASALGSLALLLLLRLTPQ